MESGDNRWLVVRWTLEISSLKVLMARLSFPPSLATRSLLENLRASRPLNDPSSREKRERERISSWNARRREITLERGITQLLRVMQAERGMRRCLPTALQGKLGPISLIRASKTHWSVARIDIIPRDIVRRPPSLSSISLSFPLYLKGRDPRLHREIARVYGSFLYPRLNCFHPFGNLLQRIRTIYIYIHRS